jgi:hypothetical protein
MRVAAAQAALEDRDRATLRLLLHPYLLWTRAGGVIIRGRVKVLDLLTEPPDQPEEAERRDGQIYRWRSG